MSEKLWKNRSNHTIPSPFCVRFFCVPSCIPLNDVQIFNGLLTFHFVRWKSISVRFASIFLPLNCAQIYFFFSIFFTMIDQLLFVFAWFVLVLTYIFSHIKLHFVCLLLRHIWVKICKNYAEFFVLLNCPTEIHSKAMERTMVEVWKRGGKVFASASKLTINLHDNWLELGCHGVRRLQSITNCQPPYWINKKRIYFT